MIKVPDLSKDLDDLCNIFLSPIDVFDNEVKRNDYKPMIHYDSATISLGLMNIACTLLIFIKQLHLFERFCLLTFR